MVESANGSNRRLFMVWLILVAISLAYLWIDHTASHQGFPTASTIVTVVAICFALIKVRIIMREFMEVRGAPVVLRRLTDFWVVLMAGAMLGVYLAGKAVA
jgi:Prokaryotic Cytochrome C oxidase subunit IV